MKQRDNSDYNAELGARIRKYRKSNGITMKELGEKLSLHEATIQKYEVGKIKKVDTDLIIRFAKALNVNPNDLFFNAIETFQKSDIEMDHDFFIEYQKLTRKNKEALLYIMRQLKDE